MKGRTKRHGGLFRRIFAAVTAALLITVLVFSLLMVTMIRQQRAEALKAEVLLQARYVADMLPQYGRLSLFSGSWVISDTMLWKINEIRENYDATVWIADSYGRVTVLGDTSDAQERLNDPNVIEEILKVLSGSEISVQGLIKELGSDMVTIGVPCVTSAGEISHAVLFNISTDNLSADYSDLIRCAVTAGVIAMALGLAFSWYLAGRELKPIRVMELAVEEYSKGNLESRVELMGDDEISELGRRIDNMAEELSRLELSRREFVASVSHELRSPLTCIRGYVEGMLDGVIDEEDREKYLKITLDETRRLTNLVNELLDLNRLESGTFSLEMVSFDLKELIIRELFKFEKRIEEKEIDITADMPEQPIMVRADADSIRQVVTNLLDNAVKFADIKGRISVSIRPEGKKAWVTVFNTGEMIPAEKLPMVFDRFFKSDNARTSGNGSGLGLAITKNILKQHGEDITVKSDMSGTRFTFSLALSDTTKEKQTRLHDDERGAT